ncbi:MAG: penicillin-binding protein activator LpoB [Gammaproteobacteria bacterium]|nr:penicillin-binding protein activator LpoB [Gammaproteobacteria bacterium]
MKKMMSAVLSGMICLGIPFSQALAAKPVIGVAEFTNDTNAGWWGRSVGWELSGMVTNEMAATGKFRMVERSKLEPVLREQNLGASGRVRKGTGAKIGKITGAKYLIMGTVTSYEERTSGGSGGISFKGISIGGRKDEAYIAVDLRVVNTTTGEIDYVRTVEAKSGSQGLRVGIHRGGFGGSLGGYKKTPAGRAIRAVIVEITDYLQCVMVDMDGCEDDYAAKEQHRRKSIKSSIKLF